MRSICFMFARFERPNENEAERLSNESAKATKSASAGSIDPELSMSDSTGSFMIFIVSPSDFKERLTSVLGKGLLFFSRSVLITNTMPIIIIKMAPKCEES